MPVGGGFEGNRELTLSGVGGRGCSTTALIMYRHGRSLDFAGEGGTGEGGEVGGEGIHRHCRTEIPGCGSR